MSLSVFPGSGRAQPLYPARAWPLRPGSLLPTPAAWEWSGVLGGFGGSSSELWVCQEGQEVRTQPSLRISSSSISVAFFSSSLMCSSRSRSCSWWDRTWGGQHTPRAGTSVATPARGPCHFIWCSQLSSWLLWTVGTTAVTLEVTLASVTTSEACVDCHGQQQQTGLAQVPSSGAPTHL